jgi:hypothetical protein
MHGRILEPSRTLMSEPTKDAMARRREVRMVAMIVVAAMSVMLLAVTRESEWTAMLWIWVVHLVIGAMLSAPVVFAGRKRVHWRLLDLSAFLLPFSVWVALLNAVSLGKGSTNLLGEPFILSLAIAVAALTRVVVGSRVDERLSSISLVAILCLTAAAIYGLTPSLPE